MIQNRPFGQYIRAPVVVSFDHVIRLTLKSLGNTFWQITFQLSIDGTALMPKNGAMM
jgi:hypothetical protein